MKISIIVKANSKLESIEKIDNNNYVIRVNKPPIEGKANKRICEMLAEYFSCSKSSVEIIAGLKSKKKTVEIKE